jgi:ABC-type multidrug transport system fused ATPase/permease subunit
MVDIVDGEIFLDGQNISHMPPYLIRRRLSCLTQDPFLFTDTIRVNADPLSEHSDVDIVSALARAGLWSVIQAKTEGGGSSSSSSSKAPLDEKMDETFFSHGQRQLFCLARALLKESPVLILDEPTSSVDGQTDAKMQEVIRSEFQGRTIIMIAHRLSTLLDFDRIVVLDRGELVEVAVPGELLGDESSAFSRLYRAAGRKRKGDEAE